MPVPEEVGVPETCQVALPPLLEVLVINIPGGMGAPETKLMLGLTNTLLVEQEERTRTAILTLPLTVTEQLVPDIA